MKEINWGILGPGDIANSFAKAINEVNGKLYAVGSRSLEKAESFKEKHNVEKAYGSYEEMLKDENINVVYISTPHSNHYEYIMESLRNNKHVLCEKAITVSGTKLKEITDLADSKNLIVAEAMTIFHMPLFKKLREVLNSGKIGKLKMIQVSFGSCKEDDPTNRFFNMDLAGGALYDIGTYALSFARYFLSSNPEEILTTVKKYQTGADEQSGIILKNKEEEMAVVTLTMRAKMPKRGIVAGDLGFITVDDFPRAEKATITYLDGRTEVIQEGSSALALNYEVEEMNKCILNNKKSDNLELTIDTISIMDEVRKSWGITFPFEK
jgi:predicted dehydrogenase